MEKEPRSGMSVEDISIANITRLLDDIKLHVNTDIFKCHLQKCSRGRLESWTDDNNLDLLHHAVLEKNFVVVGLFFAMGYFKPPHQVAISWTYVHVAAILGQRTIVSMLLQERPFDNRKVVLDWDLFHHVISPKLDISQVTASIVPTEDKEKQFAFLPLDLAARYGHAPCVKTILDFHIFQSQQSQGPSRRASLANMGHMNMACTLDSPFALRILLTDHPETEDVKNALDVALKMAKPECVDALLRFGVDTKLLFGGMNLFHVLYAYSKSFEEYWFESFVTVTSVLLRHHQDVNACRPSRTFPLYSLLRCTRISCIETSAPFVMAVLLLLLKAGADPNFDEVLVEEAVRDREHHTAFGRKPYPSALHCVLDAAFNLMEEVSDAEHVRKYVYKCCELLLRHGADPSYVGKYPDVHSEGVEREGSALHMLCDVTPRLGRVDGSLLLLLLRHGADPDACVDGRYPLMAYLDAACPAPPSPSPPDRPTLRDTSPPRRSVAGGQRSEEESVSELAADVRRMCRMVGFMSHTAQHHCATLLRSRLVAPPGQQRPWSEGLKVALREVEKYTTCVPSLRRCCAVCVWCQCRRHVGNLYKLPIPMPLVNVVMDYV
ncbi:uncharacterized protein LOC143297825 [Babylonia areolata]|uniref:uncharacterized protein LOC143297825 n=1 Tax=Babylonia areolata TaxID=304850 RepID=UPI003FD2FC92